MELSVIFKFEKIFNFKVIETNCGLYGDQILYFISDFVQLILSFKVVSSCYNLKIILFLNHFLKCSLKTKKIRNFLKKNAETKKLKKN